MELFVWVEISIIIITRIVTYKTIYYKYLRKPKKTRSHQVFHRQMAIVVMDLLKNLYCLLLKPIIMIVRVIVIVRVMVIVRVRVKVKVKK